MGKRKLKTLLHLAQEVTADTDEAVSMIPDDEADVIMESFTGNFTATKAATICCIWDYGGTEVVIDLSNAGPKQVIGTGDGVKKVALVLTNAESVDTIAMSGTIVVGELVDV